MIGTHITAVERVPQKGTPPSGRRLPRGIWKTPLTAVKIREWFQPGDPFLRMALVSAPLRGHHEARRHLSPDTCRPFTRHTAGFDLERARCEDGGFCLSKLYGIVYLLGRQVQNLT
jgi:hypothetical protein